MNNVWSITWPTEIWMSFLSLSDNLLQDTNTIIIFLFLFFVLFVFLRVVLFCFVCLFVFNRADSFEIAREGVKCLTWFEVQFPLVQYFVLFYFIFLFFYFFTIIIILLCFVFIYLFFIFYVFMFLFLFLFLFFFSEFCFGHIDLFHYLECIIWNQRPTIYATKQVVKVYFPYPFADFTRLNLKTTQRRGKLLYHISVNEMKASLVWWMILIWSLSFIQPISINFLTRRVWEPPQILDNGGLVVLYLAPRYRCLSF